MFQMSLRLHQKLGVLMDTHFPDLGPDTGDDLNEQDVSPRQSKRTKTELASRAEDESGTPYRRVLPRVYRGGGGGLGGRLRGQ